MLTHASTIQSIVSPILQEELDYSGLLQAVRDYKSFLMEFVKEDIEDKEGRQHVFMDNGKAIGTYWAVLCIDDMIRTRSFMRGVKQALEDKLKSSDHQIHFLYAGTGPFATLVLPFMAELPADRIKWTLLEINPKSINILHRVIQALGLNEKNIDIIQADATRYQLTESVDIILTETMQTGLRSEQHVPITLNLISQVDEECLLLPQKIELSISALQKGIPVEQLTFSHFKGLGKIFELSKEESKAYLTDTPLSYSFPKNSIHINKEELVSHHSLFLTTDIYVYAQEKIGLKQSGLTLPLKIGEVPKKDFSVMEIQAQYQLSDYPDLTLNFNTIN